jgi:hypothetical protein
MCDPHDRPLRHLDRDAVQERYEADLSVAEDVGWALTRLDRLTQWLLDSGVAAHKEEQLSESRTESEYYAGRASAFFAAEQELSRLQATS